MFGIGANFGSPTLTGNRPRQQTFTSNGAESDEDVWDWNMASSRLSTQSPANKPRNVPSLDLSKTTSAKSAKRSTSSLGGSSTAAGSFGVGGSPWNFFSNCQEEAENGFEDMRTKAVDPNDERSCGGKARSCDVKGFCEDKEELRVNPQEGAVNLNHPPNFFPPQHGPMPGLFAAGVRVKPKSKRWMCS
mmetsp:Transcript_38699/g.111853  ORF Transcript_38699/g.111853 Transcript_38699/m.111853 type:complete len:189 (-) Transcript_38699:198-764(-)